MAERYAHLRTERWVGLAVGALVVSVVCVLLGLWQWGRHEDRVAAVDQVEANWDAAATGLDEIVARGLTVGPQSQWQTVRLEGRWIPTSTVLLRNRPVQATPALHALSQLLADLDDGGEVAVVVVRGWLPVDGAPVPEVPGGVQEVLVRMRVEEGAVDRVPPPGQVYTLHTSEVVRAAGIDLDVPVLQGYAQVVEAESPLRGFPEPDRDLGPHLSYAFQWWFFAGAVPVGVVILARREAEEEDVPRQRIRPADEIAEDDLVERQLRQASEISSA